MALGDEGIEVNAANADRRGASRSARLFAAATAAVSDGIGEEVHQHRLPCADVAVNEDAAGRRRRRRWRRRQRGALCSSFCVEEGGSAVAIAVAIATTATTADDDTAVAAAASPVVAAALVGLNAAERIGANARRPKRVAPFLLGELTHAAQRRPQR